MVIEIWCENDTTVAVFLYPADLTEKVRTPS